MEEEEYELVPMSPIRRLEKRMDTVEKSSASQQMMKEVMEIIRSNQEIVEDIVKVNSEMISRVSELANRVDMLMAKFNEFVSRIEIAAEAEEKTGSTQPAEVNMEQKLNERLGKIEKRLNAVILSSLAKQKLVRRA